MESFSVLLGFVLFIYAFAEIPVVQDEEKSALSVAIEAYAEKVFENKSIGYYTDAEDYEMVKLFHSEHNSLPVIFKTFVITNETSYTHFEPYNVFVVENIHNLTDLGKVREISQVHDTSSCTVKD